VFFLLPEGFRTVEVMARVEYLTAVLPRGFAKGVVQPYVLHPLKNNDDLEWSEFPKQLKEEWEWNFLGDISGAGYDTWGVDRRKGIVGVLRPDGMVGGVWDVEECAKGGQVEHWLMGALKRSAANGVNGKA